MRTRTDHRAGDWRVRRRMAGARARLFRDRDGRQWEVWYQGKSTATTDLVRFYRTANRARLGGIPTGTWDSVAEEELERALTHSVWISG